MPNVDNPHGLEPLHRSIVGGCVRGRAYSKLVGESTAIFRNDAVQATSGGGIAAGGTPGTDLWQGVSMNYGAASTATEHIVIDDPAALFDCQDDGDSGSFSALTDRNLNANLIFNAGSAVRFISGHEIDISTKATTATLDLKLLQLIDDPTNAYGVNARVMVAFNKHRLTAAVAGV